MRHFECLQMTLRKSLFLRQVFLHKVRITSLTYNFAQTQRKIFISLIHSKLSGYQYQLSGPADLCQRDKKASETAQQAL